MSDLRCIWCDGPVVSLGRRGIPKKYCSERCRYQMKDAERREQRAANDLSGFWNTEPKTVPAWFSTPDKSPDEWDGVTRHHVPPPITRDYYLTCMLCARQEPLKLTDSDARLMRQRRCLCGSRMLLELDAGRATQPSARPTVRKPNPVLAETRI